MFMLLLAKWLDFDPFSIAPSEYVQLVVAERHIQHEPVCVFAPIARLSEFSEALLDYHPVRVIDLTVLNFFNHCIVLIHVFLDISQTEEHFRAAAFKPERRLVRVGRILLRGQCLCKMLLKFLAFLL